MTVNAYTQTQPTQYQNTYVPIPFQEMMAVSQAYKQSYDQAQERQDKFIELSSQLGQTMIPGSGDAAVFQKEMAGVSGQIDALVNQDLRDPIVQGKLSQLQRGFMKNPFWGSAQANAKLWALQEQNKQKLIMDGKWSTVQEQDWQNYVAGFNSGDNKPFNGSLRAYNDNFDQMIATGMTGWDKYLQETRKANFANDFTSTWETDKNWREQQYGLIANAMANSEQGKLVIRNGIAEGQLKLTGDAEKDAKIAKEWLWKNYGEKTARSFVKTEHRENRSMYKMWEKSLEAGGSDRPQLTPSGPPIMGSESGLSMNDILNGKGEDAQAAYSRARNEFSSAPETDNPGVKDAYNQLDKFIKSTAGESGLKGVARMTNEDHADIMKKYNVDQGDLNDVIKTIAYAYGSGVTANEQLAEIAGKLIGKKVDETDVVWSRADRNFFSTIVRSTKYVIDEGVSKTARGALNQNYKDNISKAGDNFSYTPYKLDATTFANTERGSAIMASFGKNWEAMIKHSPLFSDGSGVKFKTPDMDGFENVKNKKGLTNDYDEKIKDFYGDIDTDSLQILIGSVGDRIGKSVITFNNKKGVEFQIPFRRDSGNEGMIADIFALAQGTDTPAMNSLVISALYPGKSSKEVAGKLLENRLSKKEQEKIVFTGRSGRGYTVEVPLGSSKSADLLNRVINANGNNSFVARFENGRLVINSDEPGKIFAALQMLNK